MKIVKLIAFLVLITLQAEMYSSRRETEAPLAKGGICYKSTPEFKAGKKACQEGLECRNTSDGPELKGRPWKCLPKKSLRREEGESVGPGEVCYRSTPDFGSKKGCPANHTCKKKPKDKMKSGVPLYCLE
jgi:hypothetical protein